MSLSHWKPAPSRWMTALPGRVWCAIPWETLSPIQSPATVNVNYTDTTAILNLELTKDPATGETTVSHINYVPLLVLNRGANVQDRYIILDVNAAIAEYKAGNTTTVSDAVYQKLEYALEGCHTILGEKYDTAGSPPAGSAA